MNMGPCMRWNNTMDPTISCTTTTESRNLESSDLMNGKGCLIMIDLDDEIDERQGNFWNIGIFMVLFEAFFFSHSNY